MDDVLNGIDNVRPTRNNWVLLMFQKFKISRFYASEQSHATSEEAIEFSRVGAGPGNPYGDGGWGGWMEAGAVMLKPTPNPLFTLKFGKQSLISKWLLARSTSKP
ncbi:hypothetical protein MTR_4g039450 [Medicago truncatula]|uniref:Uncharacterized protein n=1 Tax=Medicago truncatula TaxID=3880 RepID=G7JTK2_MEDTR|nr:hypothetical protein MTR_4g039450 [Medicago truncatula]